MSLDDRIAGLARHASKNGLELYGYQLRPDGSIIPMIRAKGVGRMIVDSLAEVVPAITRGAASREVPLVQTKRPRRVAQGDLF